MPKQYLRGWATVFFGTKYIPSTRHRLKMIGKPLLRALREIDKNNFASEEIKAGILKIGINKCARESGFDRKNFIRKLVHGIPVKRNSYHRIRAVDAEL
jgi:hypothetical protein